MKTLSYILLSFCILYFSSAKAEHCENCPKTSNDSVETHWLNTIENMNKQELNRLVDLLFDLDTVSTQLMNDIKAAYTKFKTVKQNKPAFFDCNASEFPSQEFYSEWDEKELFPKHDILFLKEDTSITLTLKGEIQGDYYHPYKGMVTSNFGWRENKLHNGIDIDLNRGDRVAAAFDGMVRVSKYSGAFGNVVVIRHYNGLETVYAHLLKLKVKPGQVVIAGQTVGLGGSTGHSTGSHLHFEIRFKGIPIDPKCIISFTDQRLRYEEVLIKKTKWGISAYPKDLKYYTVEKGDTVLSLAKRFATTTSSIKKLNSITGRLKEGQIINISQ